MKIDFQDSLIKDFLKMKLGLYDTHAPKMYIAINMNGKSN